MRRTLAIAASLAALAAVMPGTARADAGAVHQEPSPSALPTSLFRRAAQAIQGAFLGDSGSSGSSSGAQAPAQPKLVDPWEAEAGLGVMRRLLNGDRLGVVLDMAHNPELEQIWGNPRATYRLLQNYPMLGGITGVKEIMAKGEEELVAEDGLSVLRSLRQLTTSFVKLTADMADPDKVGSVFEEYGAKLQGNPAWEGLLARMEEGDRGAANELVQMVANEAWGGLIDLNAFGLDGTYPEQLARSRDQVLKEEPDLFELVHQNNAFVKDFLKDPTSIYKIVQDAIDDAEATGQA